MPTPMEVLRQQAGGAGNSFKFDQQGDRVALQVVNYKVSQQEKGRKGSGEWEDVLILTGPNLLRGGEPTDLFISGSRATAMFNAMSAVGATDIEVGAVLDMTFTHTQDTGNIQPMKVYSATYQRPAPGAGNGAQEFFQGQAQPQPPPPQQAPPPQYQQAPQQYPQPQAPPQQYPQQGYPPQAPPQQYPQQPPPPPQQLPPGYFQQAPQGGQQMPPAPPQGVDPATLFGTAPPQ